LKCRKLKANQAARTVPKNKKVEESKFQTAQIARTSEIYLFMAQKVTVRATRHKTPGESSVNITVSVYDTTHLQENPQRIG